MDLRFAVFVGLFLIGSCQGQHRWPGFGNDWVRDLLVDIDRMTADIHTNVRHMQAEIQQNIQKQLAEADRLTADINKTIGSLNGTSTFSSSGNTIIINGSHGGSRSVISGHTADGTPYIRDVEEKYVGNVLHHTEKIYNPQTKKVETIKWKLDLSTPGAKPEIITDGE